ncbi:hypothetical protein FH972_023851 [Carpinus fangiana]|uniref:NodB homology domain-containing protein n=1 Tax=Carpinus fangiana TaxID=176857 RepID=A0A5N6KWV3_9ROSI|nr:hypothetical protein FH972_023851 [Carpinus fangiana]
MAYLFPSQCFVDTSSSSSLYVLIACGECGLASRTAIHLYRVFPVALVMCLAIEIYDERRKVQKRWTRLSCARLGAIDGSALPSLRPPYQGASKLCLCLLVQQPSPPSRCHRGQDVQWFDRERPIREESQGELGLLFGWVTKASMRLVPSLFRLPSRRRIRLRRSRLAMVLALVVIVGLLISPFYLIYKPPGLLISYFERRWPDVLWRVATKKKIVALTIDDGPSTHTSEIMDVLLENDAAATFFIIGSQADGHGKTLERLIRNGNELGNHAMRDEPSRSLSDATLTQQIETVRVKLDHAYAAAGVKPPQKYFRPGSGFFSNSMRAMLTNLDYRLVLGSVYPHDPQIPFWRVNAAHILSMTRPGSIIICHDRRSWTAPMLRKVLPELKRRGYQVVTVTELLKEAHFT